MTCCTTADSISKQSSIPSSLSSPPIKSTTEPGNCQLHEEFQALPLLAKYNVSPTSFVLRFGLPDSSKGLGLSTTACILAGAPIGQDGEMVVRPYTPISTNAMIGSFDLLVKRYDNGLMSKYICDLTPSPTTTVMFKHITFNVKIQYPFGSPKFIGIISGGTGITPMIQALHAILGDENSTTEKVKMLYGSRSSNDILGESMLNQWSESHSNKLEVTHVLSHEPDDCKLKSSAFKRGFIDRALVEETFPSPEEGKDVLIFVCGPPVMYDVLCGPRTSKEVTGILGDIGYTADQVFKF